ncbi:Hypothetical protein GSB_153211 [Giardia duodenalis]|uniref:Eukaryotic initiation factor 4E n=2 Tax=Giardia intestinalis TaxID=5741 RepID=C6LPL7_GIAIB|nr:Hypothetical protein GL50581_683 [Giardia intestinalis ATCC 50581]ESU43812.1 Hypothetical protein GSB_153211 [Giardia intestinalis]
MGKAGELLSSWSVAFWVPLRFHSKHHLPIPFSQQSSKVCSDSRNLDEIIASLHSIPSISKLKQANISLFRDQIECLWEDPMNAGGSIARFRCCLSEQAVQAVYQVSKTLFPLVTPADMEVLWSFICTLLLTRGLEHSSATDKTKLGINGCYLKLEKEFCTIELWFGSKTACSQALPLLVNILKELNIGTQYTKAQYPNLVANLPGLSFPQTITLHDTLTVIDVPTVKAPLKVVLAS